MDIYSPDANNIKNPGEIIDQVCECVAHWPEIARSCGVPEQMIKAIVPNMMLKL